MIRILIAPLLILLFAGAACADTRVLNSSPAACEWTYDPGQPIVERVDSTNIGGVFIEFMDADLRVCADALQPTKTFHVVVPPGLTPKLEIVSQVSSPRNQGLPGRPERIAEAGEPPSRNWAVLAGVHSWRGYRLARIDVHLQVGDMTRCEVLGEIRLRVSFVGSTGRMAPQSRDQDLLARIALNGNVASRWWDEPQHRSILDETSVWPQFDLYRLSVTETGLYQVRGNSVAGAALLNQPVNKIRMFGNGGSLLSNEPDAPADSTLKEDAILVEDRNGNGIFDLDDRVLFFGRGLKGASYCDGTYMNAEAHQSPFSIENMYFIGVDPGGPDGLRMPAISTSGGGTHVTTSVVRDYLDQDAFIYATGNFTDSGLIWYMSTLDRYQSRRFALNLTDPTQASSRLTLDAITAAGSVGNLFDIYVNDSLVSTNYFPGNVFSVTVPVGTLIPGTNSVTLQNRSGATIYVNYFEIKYERTISAPQGFVEFFAPASQTGLFSYQVSGLGSDAYFLDVTDPVHPRLALGNSAVDSSYSNAQRHYFAAGPAAIKEPVVRGVKNTPSNLDYTRLRDPSNSAGLIILTYDEGYDALKALKDFHEQYSEEPLKTIRVRLTDVYDEFGWGVHDVVAIRNFLKYAYQDWTPSHTDTTDTPLRYVLFVGDGNYDYRHLLSTSDPIWMPPWELYNDCRDDFFSIFSNGGEQPELLTGRWAVQGNSELQAVMDKTIAYGTHPLYGPWKNTATFAADDEWKDGQCGEHEHTIQAESLINHVLPGYFTFKKIYEILYPARSEAVGRVKPDATRDLIESINRGTLIVNFTGHGNDHIWTDEQLFLMDRDRNLLDNHRMWPLFVAATCSWGFFDRPNSRCFPEVLDADPTNGAVACVAATRFTFVSSNNNFTNAFYGELFVPGIRSRRSFGEAMLVGKSALGSNATEYHVLGDPVLRLATPEYFARVTSTQDSLKPLSLYHLSGIVSQTEGGAAWSDFEGVVEARVFDTEDSAAYYWPDYRDCSLTSTSALYYKLPGNAIFRGTATVTHGQFDLTFRVPRDVRYGGTNAKVSLYFYGKSDGNADSSDGIGIREHLLIANEASSERDTISPAISAWLEVPSFHSGDIVSASPRLHVNLADSSGINLSGEVGHKITGRIDQAQTEDLTAFFNYDRDSYTTGYLEKVLGPLTQGEHRIVIEAWDSFNNLTQTTLSFVVGAGGDAGYAIRDVYNWPNPMKGNTYFTYFLTQDGTRRVSLKVFTLSGKLVYELDNLATRGPAFNSNSDRPWDGRDREGHLLGNGVYFYRVKAEHSDGHTAEATGKLVILR